MTASVSAFHYSPSNLKQINDISSFLIKALDLQKKMGLTKDDGNFSVGLGEGIMGSKFGEDDDGPIEGGPEP